MAPFEVDQQTPDMPIGILDAKGRGDELRHAGSGPDLAFKAVCWCALAQQAEQLSMLLCRETRRGTGSRMGT